MNRRSKYLCPSCTTVLIYNMNEHPDDNPILTCSHCSKRYILDYAGVLMRVELQNSVHTGTRPHLPLPMGYTSQARKNAAIESIFKSCYRDCQLAIANNAGEPTVIYRRDIWRAAYNRIQAAPFNYSVMDCDRLMSEVDYELEKREQS